MGYAADKLFYERARLLKSARPDQQVGLWFLALIKRGAGKHDLSICVAACAFTV